MSPRTAIARTCVRERFFFFSQSVPHIFFHLIILLVCAYAAPKSGKILDKKNETEKNLYE